jgi:hypothetical protein
MVAGVLRTVAVVNMSFTDISYDIKLPTILCITEIGVAIIVACSPILRPVFDRIFRTIESITNSGVDQSSRRHSHIINSGYHGRMKELVGDSEVELREGEGVVAQASGSVKDGSLVGSYEDPDDVESVRRADNYVVYMTTVAEH